MNLTLGIHASGLDRFNDCPRAAVADRYQHLLQQAGYQVKTPTRYVTPTVGSGIHAAAHVLNEDYIRSGLLPNTDLVRKAAEEGFKKFKELYLKDLESQDVRFTAKFPDDSVIRNHIAQYTALYAEIVLPTRKLEASEQFFKVDLKPSTETMPGFQYISTADGYGEGIVYDLKTGDTITPAYAQIGTYIYLFKQTGFAVTGCQLDYVTKAQPGKSGLLDKPHHITIKYNAEACEKLAIYTTARLINTLEDFIKTGDINVIPINPRSEACSPMMCKLYGTTSCTGWEKEQTVKS